MDAVSFGPFRLYPAQRRLKKGEDPVKLGARAFDILLALVERAGEVVAHKELIAKVWPDVIVEEISLRVHITSLRKALDGEQSSENYITNVKGRGYCFIAPVSYERSAPDVKSPLDTSIYNLPRRLARTRGRDDTVRLERIANPGGILISETVYSETEGKWDVGFEDSGEQQLEKIPNPVRAYAVSAGAHSEPIDSLGAALPLPDKPSIAVLPFQNLSSDPEQEFFADGMVEEIITALSRFKALFVIARNSSFTYKGRAVQVKQVGRELGVRYVLEGSVRKAANRVRIAGQLIDAATGAYFWADRFDGGLGDIFDLQDQVTERVVGALAPAVETAEIERAKYKPTESLDAHTIYLRGLAKFYQYGNEQATAEALRLFNSAIELDPDFALAYSHASHCYAHAKTNSWSSGTANEIAEASRLAQRALELGKDDASVLCGSGWTLAFVVRDLGVGTGLVDRALMLNSNLAEAWRCSGWMKIWLGDPKLAIEHFARAMRLSPLGRWLVDIQSGIAHAHFFLGRYDEAASWAALALQNNPDFQAGIRIGAATNAIAGRTEDAHETVVRLRRLNPTLRVSNLEHVLGPYRRAEDLALYEEGLRKAGLPE
jgi:adenylate cyclase